MEKLMQEQLDHLTMRLFAPGMSMLHRAGLGGLACTLKAMEDHYLAGRLQKEKLPAPFVDGVPPWEVKPQSISLRFAEPKNAGQYLRKLFAFAFQVREGLIYLPGQYGNVSPSTIVLAALQDGIQNTFLQHGPTCGSRDGERTVSVEVNDTSLSVTHDVFTSYKHQGWFWFERDEKSKEKDPITGKKIKTGQRVKNHQIFPVISKDGTLSGNLHNIDNKMIPGGMVRHDRFKTQSAVQETDAGLVCLHFALIGCVALSINRVKAVLLVPEVHDLNHFADVRQFLTPQTAQQCRIAGAADAALQAQVRLRARREARQAELPAFYAVTCRPTTWNEKQKPRVGAINVSADDAVLKKFESAMDRLSARLFVPKPPKPNTKRASETKKKQPFWADSVIRPLIAENLALGRPWYAGFTGLTIDLETRNQLPFERKGLYDMLADPKMWDHDGEKLVVQAVHEAIRMRYGRIANENKGNLVGMMNRMDRFRERLRISLSGAKREADVRFALMDLFSRGGNNIVLRERWTAVLPIIRKDWQLARDLGLLALASYAGEGDADILHQTETNI